MNTCNSFCLQVQKTSTNLWHSACVCRFPLLWHIKLINFEIQIVFCFWCKVVLNTNGRIEQWYVSSNLKQASGAMPSSVHMPFLLTGTWRRNTRKVFPTSDLFRSKTVVRGFYFPYARIPHFPEHARITPTRIILLPVKCAANLKPGWAQNTAKRCGSPVARRGLWRLAREGCADVSRGTRPKEPRVAVQSAVTSDGVLYILFR